eukprot:9476053-Pyramimonas_sp.AAC.1
MSHQLQEFGDDEGLSHIDSRLPLAHRGAFYHNVAKTWYGLDVFLTSFGAPARWRNLKTSTFALCDHRGKFVSFLPFGRLTKQELQHIRDPTRAVPQHPVLWSQARGMGDEAIQLRKQYHQNLVDSRTTTPTGTAWRDVSRVFLSAAEAACGRGQRQRGMPVLAECKPDVLKSKQRVADSYASHCSARGTPTVRQTLANYRVDEGDREAVRARPQGQGYQLSMSAARVGGDQSRDGIALFFVARAWRLYKLRLDQRCRASQTRRLPQALSTDQWYDGYDVDRCFQQPSPEAGVRISGRHSLLRGVPDDYQEDVGFSSGQGRGPNRHDQTSTSGGAEGRPRVDLQDVVGSGFGRTPTSLGHISPRSNSPNGIQEKKFQRRLEQLQGNLFAQHDYSHFGTLGSQASREVPRGLVLLREGAVGLQTWAIDQR